MVEDELHFSGDLLLELAEDGRLVLEESEADEIITGIERTMSVLRLRQQQLEAWRRSLRGVRDTHCLPVEQFVIDAVFAEQIWPGRTEAALRELPKYLEAFRNIRLRASGNSEEND